MCRNMKNNMYIRKHITNRGSWLGICLYSYLETVAIYIMCLNYFVSVSQRGNSFDPYYSLGNFQTST